MLAAGVVATGTEAPGRPVVAGAPIGGLDDVSCNTSPAVAGEVYVVCDLLPSASSVDLASLPGFRSGSSAPVWIQAWGGAGGDVTTRRTLPGGPGGFAQVVTSLAEFESRFGTTTLYYALGEEGQTYDSELGTAGGGGAATLVTSVDPASTALDTSTNVVAIAAGGGGSVNGCIIEHFCDDTPGESAARGGRGGIAMSNAGGENKHGRSGEFLWGGRGGGGGIGGEHVKTLFGNDGFNGASGIGGQGGDITGYTSPVRWVNNVNVSAGIGSAGAGANSAPCMSYNNRTVCISGGGGGGWGGGASGSNGNAGRYHNGAGGGGGSFASPSPVSDPNAPTAAPDPPGASTVGVVRVAALLDFRTAFCREDVLAGTEGFRCAVPFNWQFQIPQEYTGQDWLVTLQALGGRGGNGGMGGHAQTTMTTTGLAGKPLYAWVGADGVESAHHGGGGGGASALSTSPDPFNGATGNQLSPDLLLVAGGGGGGTGLNPCVNVGNFKGGNGGVAVSSGGVVRGNGEKGQSLGGGGGTHANAVWNGGAGGSGQGSPGGAGPGGLMFEGGPGAYQPVPYASTVASSVMSTPTTNGGTVVPSAGGGGQGSCWGGGGGAGAGGGGGGAGGSGSPATTINQGGGGGGGGSFAAATDVQASQFPAFAKEWLTLKDQTSGQISLFFFKAGQGPPPVPANGATIKDVQPTLGLLQSRSGSFAYRVTDETTGTTFLGSPFTTNERWTIPTDGFLTPGHTYSWEIVDESGAVVQPARKFTVDPSTGAETSGVTLHLRSMSPYATASSPAWLKPEQGQPVPRKPGNDALWESSTPQKCVSPGQQQPNCYEYSGKVDDVDSYGGYMRTATAVQAQTNPGAVNMQFGAFDPFGLGVSALFTLVVTGKITVPFTDTYTFGAYAFGGTNFTLKDPSGATVGGNPMIDSWGMVSNCSYSFVRNVPYADAYGEEASELASLSCVNSNGIAVARQSVHLTAGVEYSFQMAGFMSYQPGPFQLLYTSPLLAKTMTPVPGSWLTTAPLTGATEPPPTVPTVPTVPAPATPTLPAATGSASPLSPVTVAPTLPATGPSPTTVPVTALAIALVAFGGALLAIRRRT